MEVGMNHDRIAGNWKQVIGGLKVRWGKLIDAPLVIDAGTFDQHEGMIQERYGISQENSARELEDFLERNRNWQRLNT
jgi:uncharacterized protein YjbJ (UPF0337 family)